MMAGNETHRDALTSNDIFSPVVLPCGSVLSNRLVKVAMYEHLASFFGGPPNDYHLRLYSEWAKHDWGMIITGNVQIMKDHGTLGRDMAIPASLDADELLQPFRELADAIHGVRSPCDGMRRNKTLAIMQLNHTGRQAANVIGGRLPLKPPLAPSAVRVGSGKDLGSRMLNTLLFQVPQAMSHTDVCFVMDRFVDGAILAHRTGFDGVQLHAAHGYLLAQFLSPKTNLRTDCYSNDNALDIIRSIAKRIRKSTSKEFAICIKLNVADYLPSASRTFLSEGEKKAIQHLLTLACWGLFDIVEVSGGDYESPDFMSTPDSQSSKSARAALFSRFSHQALQALDNIRDTCNGDVPLILLTGGLRTPRLMCSALSARHADLLGVGRGSVLCPDLPSLLRERLEGGAQWYDVPFCNEPDLRRPWLMEVRPFIWIWNLLPKVNLVGAGVAIAWYTVAMRNIANAPADAPAGSHQPMGLGSLQVLLSMYFWTPYCRTRSSFISFCFLLFLGIFFHRLFYML
ncbi:hypothetical protein D9613_005353 [Agrocybe pediades]|uniref:NADH:flavin oxidoreductase/NADH oxidase N-terminal domain-containing protein n=1 Tax=Agrocybe pediades TaxID=84607 RepID=A0A8H4QXP1_9AGAR|nr:hypothetical protein D9613_005353 [Agrocybe pediades]